MERSSRTWARRLAIAVALVVGLLVAALPATAAPTFKNYSHSLAFGAVTGQSVTVPSGVSSDVRLLLTNQPDSQQSFASAQVDFAGLSLPTAVTVSRPGWTVQQLAAPSGALYQVVNSGSLNPVRPGTSLEVTIRMPGTPQAPPPGTTVTTRIRQSNDFNGTNNDFTLVSTAPKTLQIVTAGPTSTPCAGTCTPAFTSSINKVTADLTVTSAEAFTFIAGFTLDRLSCDTIPFGPTVRPEPFQVDTQSASPVSKTLKLTFPKALANLVPNNGTPLHPVCAGGDFPFPGSEKTEGFPPGTFTHPFEGLLLNCSDPDYAAEKAAADPAAFLPMCVQSRARSAGNLVVTVLIESTSVDPRIW
jgi:hypothetical protein